MLILFRPSAAPADLDRVAAAARAAGCEARLLDAGAGPLIAVVGDAAGLVDTPFEVFPGVAKVIRLGRPYPRADRAAAAEPTVVRVGSARVGQGLPLLIAAGPCAVEDEAALFETAREVRAAGADLLRGGAFKPRTSPYAFRGLGLEGLRLLAAAGREVGLPTVTEVTDPRQVGACAQHADMLQIGTRNMSNFDLLSEVGRAGRPVLLKRGRDATVDEWLLAAEYVLAEGNAQVVLCERGVRGFDPSTRNLLDLAAVAVARARSHLPVLVDPSHATGQAALVPPMARAAVAAGADGVMVEVHVRPERARCDAAQALSPAAFAALARDLRRLDDLRRTLPSA